MSRSLVCLSLVAIAGAAGCGLQLVDPCAGVAGACVTLQVSAPPSLATIDALSLDVAGAGFTHSGPVGSGRLELPLAIGVVFGAGARLPAMVDFTVGATKAGRAVAGGTTSVRVSSGQHQTIAVLLSAPGSAPTDLGADALGDAGAAPSDLASSDGAAACVPHSFAAQQAPATTEVLIVQQLGGNMTEGISAMDMSSLLSTDRAGLDAVLDQLGDVSFGLMHYPDLSNADLACPRAGGVLDIAPAPGDAAQIETRLATMTGASTSTGTQAIVDAASYLAARPVAARFLIVVTDGLISSCDSACLCTNDTSGFTVAISNAAEIGVPSFVFGAPVLDPTASQNMIAFANAGHLANTTAGEPAYYVPGDPAALASAVKAAMARAVSCTYTLATAPGDPAAVSVASEGTILTRDPTHADGWDFGPGDQSIVVYGAACTLLRTRGDTHVDVTEGC